MDATDNIIYLPEAAAAIGRAPQSARRDAHDHGVLMDRLGDTPVKVRMSGGGTGRHYWLDRASLVRFSRLLWLKPKNAVNVNSAAARRSVGLAVYTTESPWTAVGEVQVLRDLASERPHVLTVEETDRANVVRVTPLLSEDAVRVAVEQAWSPSL